MRNSLLIKLLGAFFLVLILGGLIIGGLIWSSTRSAFSLYTTRVGQSWAQELVSPLAAYYTTHGSWQGVASILQEGNTQAQPLGTGNSGVGGMGRGPGMGVGSHSNQRTILADETGLVVYDSLFQINGEYLTTDQLSSGVTITSGNTVLGTVLVTQNETSPLASSAALFLDTVNRSILLATLAASVIAIFLGILLFRQIIAPIKKMKLAAAAIAGGNLSKRIEVTTRDELGDLATAMNQMANELETDETNRRRMIADIAHELRTPLTIIQANLEGMLDGVLRTDKKHLAVLHDETLLLNRLISDLRLLSLAEAGELVLDKEETDLSVLLPKLLEKYQPAALERHIELIYSQRTDLPHLFVDPDRISQVVTNLIANALNYTPENGSVRLNAYHEAGWVTIEVSDSGSGIPAEDLPLVFNRFYRVDQSRARKTGGSGLGLSIVKYLVEAHGGSIMAISPISEDPRNPGTCIRFTLPVPG